jgi:hypothetical protein
MEVNLNARPLYSLGKSPPVAYALNGRSDGAGQDAVARREISAPVRNRSPVAQPVTCHNETFIKPSELKLIHYWRFIQIQNRSSPDGLTRDS